MGFMKTITTFVAALPTAAAVVLIAGCSSHDAPQAPPPSARASSSPGFAPNRVSSTPQVPSENPSSPSAVGRCTDGDLQVTNGPLESADTQRRVVVSFRNVSSHQCALFGYPGVDLVTPAGGVLINVPRRPAAAAHHLTLDSGDVATADVQAYAIDTSTGDSCPRWGNVVVTPPNDYVSHSLPRICPSATRPSAPWTDIYVEAELAGTPPLTTRRQLTRRTTGTSDSDVRR